jgi:hypothetical protein
VEKAPKVKKEKVAKPAKVKNNKCECRMKKSPQPNPDKKLAYVSGKDKRLSSCFISKHCQLATQEFCAYMVAIGRYFEKSTRFFVIGFIDNFTGGENSAFCF